MKWEGVADVDRMYGRMNMLSGLHVYSGPCPINTSVFRTLGEHSRVGGEVKMKGGCTWRV